MAKSRAETAIGLLPSIRTASPKNKSRSKKLESQWDRMSRPFAMALPQKGTCKCQPEQHRVEPMFIAAVLLIMVFEVGAFGLAASLHFGLSIFGLAESPNYSEAAIQGAIGCLIAISAAAIWTTRRNWARRSAIGAHLLGLVGALFGILVGYLQNIGIEIDLYDLARLTALALVPVLLLTPTAKDYLGW